MKTIQIIIALCLAAILFTSCATQNIVTMQNKDKADLKTETAAFNYNPNYEYTLQKDDKVSISVWDNDDLSVGSIYGIYNSNEVYGKWLMLDATGNVTVPKLGEINLMGLTVPQAKEKLTVGFKKWIVNPIIEVKVLNKEVNVLGELKTPGKYLLEKDNNTLLDVIAKAGDFDFYANKKKIQVVRLVNDQPVTIVVDLTKMDDYLSSNIQIHPGDVVYVPSRKGKHWDKRAGSTIVPLASLVSTLVLVFGFLRR
jgi:polysaccharide export outer membrane protein